MTITKPDGATVIAVAKSPGHSFSKATVDQIQLVADHGVDGDAHAGVTVKHRSRVAQDPTQPNLRQVHLIHQELIDELRLAGFRVGPGVIGENITTQGIDLLGLSRGTQLHLGDTAIVEITGLRNPCAQLDAYQAGLTQAVLGRDAAGNLVRKAGIMGIVRVGGSVRSGSAIRIESPDGPHIALERV